MSRLKFNKEIINIVNELNKKLLSKGKLSTNPNLLLYHSYDSYDVINNKIPINSICRFTIDGLKHIFPLIKFELGNNNEIIVEDIILKDFNALPNKNHIDYIKEIMLDIFILYKNDENKIPKDLYKWFFNNNK